MVDILYYRNIIGTQNNPEILKLEMHDLLNELEEERKPSQPLEALVSNANGGQDIAKFFRWLTLQDEIVFNDNDWYYKDDKDGDHSLKYQTIIKMYNDSRLSC